MHHCLTIPEILHLILDFYDVHGLKDDMRTVIAIAYTCRSFGHPALDRIWSSLKSLRPLFKCLPEDSWEERAVENVENPRGQDNTKMRLKRSLVSEDWARIDLYIHKVKALSIQDYKSFTFKAFVDREIFEALAKHYRGSLPLLPNLLYLDWDGDTDVYSYISLFLGPQLIGLSFCAPNFSNIPSAALVTSMKVKCPYIQALGVYHAYNTERSDLYTSVSDVIGHCSTLENIYCAFPLAPTTIVHLSRLETLKTIHLFDHPLAIVHSLADTSASIPFHPFHNLTNLTIESWDGPSLIQLVRTLNSSQLCELVIVFREPSTFTRDRNFTSLSVYHPSIFEGYRSSAINDPDVTRLFEAVCISFPHLRSLLVSNWPPAPNSPPMILSPLFRLTSLTSLNLFGDHAFELDDDTLHEMTSAWPSLHTLTTSLLVTIDIQVVRPKVTLRGLSDFLCRCSQLKSIRISIYVPKDDITVLKDVLPNRSIQVLDLGCSWAEEGVGAKELGEVITSLCPSLHSFHVFPKNGCLKSWKFTITPQRQQ